MKPASGITTRGYKSGSIIYFEGDKSEYIFILKQGRVILTSNKIEQGEIVETKEEIKPGEFFGVKSSLGKYPRDETAQTFGDTIVLVLTLADFETLVLKNVNVVKKMLRVFSNQLRKIGKINRETIIKVIMLLIFIYSFSKSVICYPELFRFYNFSLDNIINDKEKIKKYF